MTNQDLSTEFLNAILAASPDAITITDFEGRIILTSPRSAKMFGSDDPDFYKGRTLLDFLDSSCQEKAINAIQQMHQGNFAGAEEYIGIRADGKRLEIEVNGDFIRNESGAPTHMIFVTRDITERKKIEALIVRSKNEAEQNEQRLRESNERAYTIMDSLEAFIYIADMQTNELLFVNDYGRKSWGTNIIGWKCYAALQGLDAPCEFCNNCKLIDGEGNPTGSLQWEFQNLVNQRWYKIHDRAIRWTDGRIVRMEVATDITDQKIIEGRIRELNVTLEQRIAQRTKELEIMNENLLQEVEERRKAEEELLKARIDAEQANKAKNDFLSRMSHELRTPMNSILGFAQILKLGEFGKSGNKGIDHILHSGKLLLELINEVLDISKIESGQLSMSIEPVQVDVMVQETIDIMMPLAIENQVTIEIPDPPGDSLFVNADRQRMKQILINLVNNAIKYNKPGGRVRIKIQLLHPSGNGPSLVRISVIDTGLGITSENMPKIFNPFERVGAEKTTTEGTGLGLAVVKKLMDVMGGQIGIESVPDEGSTFWIEFPLCENIKVGAQNMHRSPEESCSFVSKGTVLYIEDNVSNLELMGHILSSRRPGISMIPCRDGLQALPLAERHHPDLILLDLGLPDIHGSEVLKLLQKKKETRNIPVVIVTADALPTNRKKFVESGARDYLTKPLEVPKLLKVLDIFIH